MKKFKIHSLLYKNSTLNKLHYHVKDIKPEAYWIWFDNKKESEKMPDHIRQLVDEYKKIFKSKGDYNPRLPIYQINMNENWYNPDLGLRNNKNDINENSIPKIPVEGANGTIYYVHGPETEVSGRYNQDLPMRRCLLTHENYLNYWDKNGLENIKKLAETSDLNKKYTENKECTEDKKCIEDKECTEDKECIKDEKVGKIFLEIKNTRMVAIQNYIENMNINVKFNLLLFIYLLFIVLVFLTSSILITFCLYYAYVMSLFV